MARRGGSRRRAPTIASALPRRWRCVAPAPAPAAARAARDGRATAPRTARRRAVRAEVLHRARVDARVRVLVDFIIPRDERSGERDRRGRARVHGLHHGASETRTRHAGRDARRARLARHRVPASASARRSSTRTDAQRRADARRHRVAAEGASRRCAHGVAFFNRFRDLTASGFFSSAMGVEGPAVHRQRRRCPSGRRLPASRAREARRQLRRHADSRSSER